MMTKTRKHPCPYCGKKVIAKEIWEHLQNCPKRNNSIDGYTDEHEIDLNDEEQGKIV